MAIVPDNIDKKKEELIIEMAKRLVEMSDAAYDIVVNEIEREFMIEGGRIITNKDFVAKLNKMVENVMRRLRASPKFGGSVSKFIKRMPEIASEIVKFQKQANKITVPDFDKVKKIIIDDVMEAMLNNGLNHNFVQPLRDLVYRNATTGLSLSQAKEALREYIKGGKDKSGKLKSYIGQTAQQAVDLYAGAINKKLMETFDYNGLLITGTIIDNTSPQCKFSLNDLQGRIKRSDWPKVKAKATKKFPLVQGTTFDNLPIMLLHWGCRHGFYPVII